MSVKDDEARDTPALLRPLLRLMQERETAKKQVEDFWTEVARGYDVESRAEIEASDEIGTVFSSPIQMAMHLIWKRNPKVQALEATVSRLMQERETPLKEQPMPRCRLCGGACLFDTVVPSVVWNKVIRDAGTPEYLCAACVIQQFAVRGESFNCELWGAEFNGLPVAVHFNSRRAKGSQRVCVENTDLRHRLSEAERACQELKAENLRLTQAHKELKESFDMLCQRCADHPTAAHEVVCIECFNEQDSEVERLRQALQESQTSVKQLAGDVRAVNAANVEVESRLTLQSEGLARLIEALRDFGRHRPSCGMNVRFDAEGEPRSQGDHCTCGLFAAIASASALSALLSPKEPT